LETSAIQQKEVEDVSIMVPQVETQTDRTTQQADVVPLQVEMEATARQEEEVEDVSIPVSQVEMQTDLQMHKEPEAITFTYENVEEITTEVESQQNNASVALQQHSSFDVMALEHSAQISRPIVPTENSREEIHEVNATPAHAVSIQPQEIQVTKNVQHDLDLWARICEYDQRMAEEGFTQVLSKKQQQALKKQVLGKASYNTCAKGTHPPSQ
jgi:hypothetical protein